MQKNLSYFALINKYFLITIAGCASQLPPPEAETFHTVKEPAITYTSPKPFISEVPSKPINVIPQKPVERVLVKTMKVPFDNLRFLNAEVSFSILIEELHREVKFTIANPDIRAEFEAIKEYFIKVLKKKQVVTAIEIRYNEKELLSVKATSEDIDKINQSIIDNVRFEFVNVKFLHHVEKMKIAL